jgi:hypothetical protein
MLFFNRMISKQLPENKGLCTPGENLSITVWVVSAWAGDGDQELKAWFGRLLIGG